LILKNKIKRSQPSAAPTGDPVDPGDPSDPSNPGNPGNPGNTDHAGHTRHCGFIVECCLIFRTRGAYFVRSPFAARTKTRIVS
jgi:hypothetical protein